MPPTRRTAGTRHVPGRRDRSPSHDHAPRRQRSAAAPGDPDRTGRSCRDHHRVPSGLGDRAPRRSARAPIRGRDPGDARPTPAEPRTRDRQRAHADPGAGVRRVRPGAGVASRHRPSRRHPADPAPDPGRHISEPRPKRDRERPRRARVLRVPRSGSLGPGAADAPRQEPQADQEDGRHDLREVADRPPPHGAVRGRSHAPRSSHRPGPPCLAAADDDHHPCGRHGRGGVPVPRAARRAPDARLPVHGPGDEAAQREDDRGRPLADRQADPAGRRPVHLPGPRGAGWVPVPSVHRGERPDRHGAAPVDRRRRRLHPPPVRGPATGHRGEDRGAVRHVRLSAR